MKPGRTVSLANTQIPALLKKDTHPGLGIQKENHPGARGGGFDHPAHQALGAYDRHPLPDAVVRSFIDQNGPAPGRQVPGDYPGRNRLARNLLFKIEEFAEPFIFLFKLRLVHQPALQFHDPAFKFFLLSVKTEKALEAPSGFPDTGRKRVAGHEERLETEETDSV